ncbi:MAG TPA: hypothetical protein VMW83_01165 [Spirochaetia bacterium]|nr:hypothetical protein [Spirochaetia bacterium]
MSCIDLVAVQPYMTLSDYISPDAFFRKMDSLCQKAAACRPGDDVPAVLVFPEELATFLALLGKEHVVAGAATLDEAFANIGRRLFLPVLGRMVRYRTTSLQQAFFLLQAPSVWQVWYETFRALARSHRVWIVAGSALLPENALGYDTPFFRAVDHHIYNLSITFDPAGRVANVTRKVNLVPTQEDVLGLSPAHLADWAAFTVEGIPFANCICYDAFRVPHTANEPGFCSLLQEADVRGVKVVVQPSANPWWWDEPWVFGSGESIPLRRQQWDAEGAAGALAGCRSVEAVVAAHLLARFLDLHFDGASAIYRRGDDGVNVVARAGASRAEPASETVVRYRYCDRG